MMRLRFAAIAATLLALGTTCAKADAVEEFYKGRLVTIMVGASAGGGTDAYARAIAPYLGQYLQGHPNIIVKNKWGAGGTIAASWFSNRAERDGSVMLLTLSGALMNQVLQAAGVKYDMSKYRWIGRMADEPKLLTVWNGVAETFEDAKKKEILLSASGKGSTSYLLPTILNGLFDTKFKVITGYKGVHKMLFAVEQREVQGVSTNLYSILSRAPHFLLKDRKTTPLVVYNTERLKLFPNVPLATEFAKTERQKRVLSLMFGPIALGRSLAFPPGTPDDRVAAMRKAFNTAVADKDFLAFAKKRRVYIHPAEGEKLDAIVDSVVNAPKEIISATRDLIGTKSK